MVITALLGTVLFVVQVALAALPNIELVSLLLLLYGKCFPTRVSLGAVYLFALLEGLIYGFGIWWLMYLYVWPGFVLLCRLLRRQDSVAFWMLVSGAFGLGFGALCAIPYALGGGLAYGVSWWISGIPYDIAHGLGNVIAVLVLYRPLLRFFDSSWQKIFKK